MRGQAWAFALSVAGMALVALALGMFALPAGLAAAGVGLLVTAWLAEQPRRERAAHE
jgi:hypothetical protein